MSDICRRHFAKVLQKSLHKTFPFIVVLFEMVKICPHLCHMHHIGRNPGVIPCLPRGPMGAVKARQSSPDTRGADISHLSVSEQRGNGFMLR